MVSSFTKRPACLEHCKAWLPTSSRSSNSAISTFVRYAFFLVVSLAQRVDPSFICK
ncbi:hypothetical protein BHM03_00001379 [Ensete ventricosum]|nr:hypothetical protein BHM03_00001379 [Ensete ventricosum]